MFIREHGWDEPFEDTKNFFGHNIIVPNMLQLLLGSTVEVNRQLSDIVSQS